MDVRWTYLLFNAQIQRFSRRLMSCLKSNRTINEPTKEVSISRFFIRMKWRIRLLLYIKEYQHSHRRDGFLPAPISCHQERLLQEVIVNLPFRKEEFFNERYVRQRSTKLSHQRSQRQVNDHQNFSFNWHVFRTYLIQLIIWLKELSSLCQIGAKEYIIIGNHFEIPKFIIMINFSKRLSYLIFKVVFK